MNLELRHEGGGETVTGADIDIVRFAPEARIAWAALTEVPASDRDALADRELLALQRTGNI